MSGPYDSEEGFKRLDKAISEHEICTKTSEGSSRRLFYLALPPSVYPPVSKMIKAWCTNKCELLLNLANIIRYKILVTLIGMYNLSS